MSKALVPLTAVGAGPRLSQPQQDLHHRRLAGTRWADDADRLAAADLVGDVPEDRTIPRVVVLDRVEADRLDLAQRGGSAPRGARGIGVHRVLNPLDERQRLAQRHLGALDLLPVGSGADQQQHDRAERFEPLHVRQAGGEQSDHQDQVDHALVDVRDQAVEHLRLQVQGPGVGHEGVDPHDLPVGGAEDIRLLGHPVGLADRSGVVHLRRREALGEPRRHCARGAQHEEQHDRRREHRDRGDRVERERRSDQDHEREQVGEHLGELDRSLAGLLDLVGHQLLEMALAILGLHLPGAEHVGADQTPAHRGLDVPGDHRRQIGGRELQQQAHGRTGDADVEQRADRGRHVHRTETAVDVVGPVDERGGSLGRDREDAGLADRRGHRAGDHADDEPLAIADEHRHPVALGLLQRLLPVMHPALPARRRGLGAALDRLVGVLSHSASPSGRWRDGPGRSGCPAPYGAPPCPCVPQGRRYSPRCKLGP